MLVSFKGMAKSIGFLFEKQDALGRNADNDDDDQCTEVGDVNHVGMHKTGHTRKSDTALEVSRA